VFGGQAVNRGEIRARLAAHLRYLSVTVGERSVFQPQSLKAAEDYVLRTLTETGYLPRRQSFAYEGLEVSNIIAGDQNPDGYYILGAHYDTVAGTPGADDNASGVAVLLEVARLTRLTPLPRPWTFIGFTTEEPPAFFSPHMGSRVYAQLSRSRGDNIRGMLCLEMVGYYRQEPESQSLPWVLRLMGFPTTGNFIGLVSDLSSRTLLTRLKEALRQGCRLPAVSLAIPFGGRILPEVRLSDHASFWDEGYSAVMLTDTSFFRNPHYHGPGDVLETLDLEAMTELTLGLAHFLGQEGK
jgi:Zn-dependent M28 family amino/carboxypeptidase